MFDALNVLKGFDRSSTGLDELIALDAVGSALRSSYTQNGLPVPLWLSKRATSIREEILARRNEFLERELAELEETLSARSSEMPLHDLECRIRELQKALG